MDDGVAAISIVDDPDCLQTLEANGNRAAVVFETHTAIPTSLTRFYSRLDHPRIRRIVVPSRHNARLIRERVNPAAPVVVIPNGINHDTFTPPPTAPAWRRWLRPRRGNRPLLLWVGRLEDEKNPAEFLKIVEFLAARRAELRCLIVGDDPDYEGRRSTLLDRVSASTRALIEFRQFVPYAEMPVLYREVAESGGALISTSRHESLPMIFLEAMASGCPIVSSDVGGVRDLITDGVTGYLYRLGDPQHGAALVARALKREGSTRAMTQTALRVVREGYSIDAVASRYRDLLIEVLSPAAG